MGSYFISENVNGKNDTYISVVTFRLRFVLLRISNVSYFIVIFHFKFVFKVQEKYQA